MMAIRKTQPLVSVVTPVYNTEKYLAECIESVLNQSYENWEYVIVNNCSTDRSLEIAERYAQQDHRISIHSNEQFLNLMQNWNHSMRQISPESKYCKVVHADDWLFPDCLARMVEVAEAYPAVGIVGSYRLEEDRVSLHGLPFPSPIVKGRDICRWHLLGRPYLFGSPTSLLMRSDFIRKRDPFYQEDSIQADKEVCFDILKESDFGFVHQVLSFTRRHNDSITAVAQTANTHRIGKLNALKKYGLTFLTEQEYQRALGREVDYYHSFLVQSLFELKDRKFFHYHIGELKRLGININWFKLAWNLFLQILDLRTSVRTIRIARTTRTRDNSDRHLSIPEILGSLKNGD